MAVITTKTNLANNNLPTTLLLPFIIALAILLTYQNIKNQTSYNKIGAGVNYNQKDKTSLESSLPQNIKKSQSTKATIDKNIKVIIKNKTKQKQDITKINHNTKDASYTLTKIDTEALKIREDLANKTAKEGFKAVGDYAMEQASKGDKAWEDGGVKKTVAHAIVGATVAAIGNGDVLSGAAGAAARELASKATKDKDKTTQQVVSTLIGGAVSGGTGASVALKGEKFNRQLHEDEIKWIKQHALEFAKQNNLDPKTAQTLLTLGALGMVDAKENAEIQHMIRSGVLTQEQVANAQNYIKGHVVKERATFQDEHRHYGDVLVTPESKTQMMFTVSKEQYFNSDYDPNKDLGGNAQPNTLDVISLIPGVRVTESAVKNTAKAVDKSLTKGVDEALDIELKRPTINDNFLDSKPISRDQAKKLLEERYIKQGESPERAKRWAETTVDSFEGQITTRMVLDGDTFILNHHPNVKEYPPTGTYVIKKENANKTPYELQKELALPKSNPATVQTEVTVTKPHQVLEGEVKGQADENWAWDHATGGGQQTVVDPKSTNRDEVIGDKK